MWERETRRRKILRQAETRRGRRRRGRSRFGVYGKLVRGRPIWADGGYGYWWWQHLLEASCYHLSVGGEEMARSLEARSHHRPVAPMPAPAVVSRRPRRRALLLALASSQQEVQRPVSSAATVARRVPAVAASSSLSANASPWRLGRRTRGASLANTRLLQSRPLDVEALRLPHRGRVSVQLARVGQGRLSGRGRGCDEGAFAPWR